MGVSWPGSERWRDSATRIDLGTGPPLFVCALPRVVWRCRSCARSQPVPAALPWLAVHHALNYAVGGTIKPANAVPNTSSGGMSLSNAENMTGTWKHNDVVDFLVRSVAPLRKLRLHRPQHAVVSGPKSRRWPCCCGRCDSELPELLFAGLPVRRHLAGLLPALEQYAGMCCSVRWFLPSSPPDTTFWPSPARSPGLEWRLDSEHMQGMVPSWHGEARPLGRRDDAGLLAAGGPGRWTLLGYRCWSGGIQAERRRRIGSGSGVFSILRESRRRQPTTILNLDRCVRLRAVRRSRRSSSGGGSAAPDLGLRRSRPPGRRPWPPRPAAGRSWRRRRCGVRSTLSNSDVGAELGAGRKPTRRSTSPSST